MRNKRNASFWLKGLGLLLAVMLLFTMISKAADSFTVAKVSVSSPSARRLQYMVSAEGRIEKNRELSVITQPDILVKSILVNVGQRVEKGSILAILDRKNLLERVESIQGERRVLELQNQAAQKNAALEDAKRSKALQRARADRTAIIHKNRKARERLQNTLHQSEAALRKAKRRLEKLQESGNQEQLDHARQEVTACETDVAEQKKSLAELKDTAKAEEKAAKRAIEDAAETQTADNTVEINEISIHNLTVQINKLNALLNQKGLVKAPATGVITQLLTNVGQKTSDTAILTMTDEKAGLKFAGQLSLQDAKHISVGDSISLHSAGSEAEVTVTSLELDESREFMNISALLPARSFSLGETVSMKMEQESENYACTIPLTAIYQENGKYFVYVLHKEDTILGEQQIARKTEVKVPEQNNSYAALDSEGIKEDSQIITESDRVIKAGDRVRLNETQLDQEGENN